MPALPPVSVQQITGIDPNARRPPPRRYPLLGFGAIAIFVGLTLALAARDASRLSFGHKGEAGAKRGVHDEDPRIATLDLDRKLTLVRIGRSARALTCLSSYTWNAPDAACVRTVVDRGEEVESLLGPALQKLDQRRYPEVVDAVNMAQGLARPASNLSRMLRALETNRHPMTQQMAMNVAQLAAGTEQQIDDLLSLDNPRWDALLAPGAAKEEPKHEAPPAPPPEPVAQPVTAAAQGDAILPEQPKAAPSAAAAAAAPTLVVHGLVTPLTDVRGFLHDAGHEPDKVADATWRARTRLEALAPLLSAYRETQRAGETDGKAQAFARQIDQARSRLLRAATELSAAAKASLERNPDGLGEDPFAKADQLVSQAFADVDTAQKLAADAPP